MLKDRRDSIFYGKKRRNARGGIGNVLAVGRNVALALEIGAGFHLGKLKIAAKNDRNARGIRHVSGAGVQTKCDRGEFKKRNRFKKAQPSSLIETFESPLLRQLPQEGFVRSRA